MLGESGQPWAHPHVVLVLGLLHELHQHATGVLGMDEIDPGIRRPAPWCVVQQPDAFGTQAFRERIEVAHAAGELLNSRPALVEELGDGAGVIQRRHQLNLGAAGRRAADREHRLAHTLFGVDLLVNDDHAEEVVVLRDGLVEIRHRNADVIDCGDQIARQQRAGIEVLGGH